MRPSEPHSHLKQAAADLLRAANHVEDAADDERVEMPPEVRKAVALVRVWARTLGKAGALAHVEPGPLAARPRRRDEWRHRV